MFVFHLLSLSKSHHMPVKSDQFGGVKNMKVGKTNLITMDFVQVLFSWLHSGQTPLVEMAPPQATFSTSTVNWLCLTRVYEHRPLKS